MCDSEPGDLIEIKRQMYQHWALYLGDGYVIHMASADEGAPSSIGSLSVSSSSVPIEKAKVKKEILKEVVKGDYWRINKKYDCSHTPQPVAEIIRQAKCYIGEKVHYDVFTNNCEHFVTKLRYGKELSDQAKLTPGNLVLYVLNWLVNIFEKEKKDP